MGVSASWFPNFVALWYDEFQLESDHPAYDDWRSNRPREVRDWMREFVSDPHGYAERLNGRIATANPNRRPEERYRALQAASDAIREVGIVHIHTRGGVGEGWDEIRQHWLVAGTLTRDYPGLLLPRRERRCEWQKRRPELSEYEPGSHFESFVRWNDEKSARLATVRVRVLPELHTPIESIERTLRVGVVPLVGGMSDFIFETHDAPSGWRSFRVSLKEPNKIEAAVRTAIRESAERGCDVVLFPELCLTPEMQLQMASVIRTTSRPFADRPWLVVAGSAHTPLEDGHFHNRAIVYDGFGTEWLRHNKLHRYEIKPYEQSRYGIVDALGETPRVEDVVITPRVLEMLETPIGRVAVLICEDLAVAHFVEPLVRGLEIDWLLVPVMDGSQTSYRWTGTRARDYAGQHGTSVLVGTCAALVTAHRESEERAPRPDPGQKVGLFIQGGDTEVLPLVQTEGPEIPVVHTL